MSKRLALILSQIIIYSTMLFSSPTQPEFSKYQPSFANNLVNEFDGSFNYNIPILVIPGPDGSSYELSLVYKSGLSPQSEASWVGYGWSLNPGSIIRNVNGFPDDNFETQITYFNKIDEITNTSVNFSSNSEIWSNDFGLSASLALNYNSIYGYEFTAGLGLSIYDIMGNINLGSKGGLSSGIYFKKFISTLLSDAYDKLTKESKSDNSATTESSNKQGLFSSFNVISSIYGSLGSYFGYFNEPYRPSKTGFNFTKNRSSGELKLLPTLIPGVGFEIGVDVSHESIKSDERKESETIGFLYNDFYENNFLKPNIELDYMTEKDQVYTNRSLYLGIPFGNPDYYTVSGGELGGTFRGFSRFINSYKTPTVTGDMIIGANLGLTLDIGTSMGVGFKIAFDNYMYSKFGIKKHNDIDKQQPFLFRFSQDLSQNIDFSSTIYDSENGHSLVNYDIAYFANLPNKLLEKLPSDRIRSSSNISYNTFEQLNDELVRNGKTFGVSKSIKAYNKNHIFFNDFNQINDYETLKKQIAEFAITNAQGKTYIYGLPVFARNEAEISFGIDSYTDINSSGSLIYMKNNGMSSNKIIGQYQKNPYIAMYLLTSIHSDDYIDIKQDGYTLDDIGTYTLFTYKKTAGTDPSSIEDKDKNKKVPTGDLDIMLGLDFPTTDNDSWYRYRNPYKGFKYLRNSLSDTKDDVASFSIGERENYYLETIETKTHKVIFYTSPREDGWEVCHIDQNNSKKNSTYSCASTSVNKVNKLDSIVLYAKSSSGDKPIKRTYFEYTYEIWDGSGSNCDVGVPDNNSNNGKLTLKKVWTEDCEIREDNITPYIFSYTYPDDADYPSSSGFDYYKNFDNQLEQQPCYDYDNTDRWGYYRQDGVVKESKLNPWVSQIKDGEFDPAAWHLKSITLPSGGKTNIYYEQNDYLYVQDRPAMVMGKLSDPDGTFSKSSTDDITYRINISDIGISSLSGTEAATYLKELKNIFLTKKEKIYFKFLIALYKGNGGELSDYLNLNLFTCTSEYVDGFVNVENVNINSSNEIEITIANNEIRNLCMDYFINKKTGNLSGYNGNCNFFDSGNKSPMDHAKNIINAISSLVSIDDDVYCSAFSPDNSYFRVPVFKRKLGGGVRVRAIINQDFFSTKFESNSTINGVEYIYADDAEYSYGVATNEPRLGYEENSLYFFYKPQKEKSLLNLSTTSLELSITNDEKDQLTSPLGESLLPAPSVGYSKVIKRNIEKTGNRIGETVKEFFTLKDYPFTKEYVIDGDKIKGTDNTEIILDKPLWQTLYNGIYSIFGKYIGSNLKNAKISQGYQFIINNMNGVPKAEYQFNEKSDSKAPISYVQYEYFEPGEQVPVYYNDAKIVKEYLGREVEIFEENSRTFENSTTVGIEKDYEWSFIPLPVPIFSLKPLVSQSLYDLESKVVNKVIRYPVIQKSVTKYIDGIISKSENIAFSNKNGLPVITRSTDEFDGLDLSGSVKHDGSIYNHTYFAMDNYSNYGHKSMSEGYFFRSGDNSIYLNKIYVNNEHFLQLDKKSKNCDCLSDYLNEGDLIEIFNQNNKKQYGYYSVSNIDKDLIKLYPIECSSTILAKVDIVKNINFRVIRSAKNNKSNEVAGNIVTYGQRNMSSPDKLPISPTLTPYDTEFDPIIAQRNNFILWLNGKIYDFKNSPDPTINIEYNTQNVYLKYLDINGDCISPSNIKIEMVKSDGKIILKFKNWDPLTLSFVSEEHPLVSDLNKLFENAWSKNLYPELSKYYKEFNDIGICLLCSSDEFHNFKAFTFHLSEVQDILRGKSEEIIGLKKLMETTYSIYDGNSSSTIILGADLFKNELLECYGIEAQYHEFPTFFYNINDPYSHFFKTIDNDIKMLTGRIYLSYLDGSNKKYIEMCRQTDPYGEACMYYDYAKRNDCRESGPKNYNYIGCPSENQGLRPMHESFFVLPFSITSIQNDIEPVTGDIYDIDKVNTNNSNFFNFINQNESFTEKIGKFFCNTDGMLCFEKISDTYGENEPVVLFQIQNPNSSVDTVSNYCEYEIDVNNINESTFILSEVDGNQIRISNSDNSCAKFCLKFCPDIYPQYEMDGVLQANASTFKNKWERTNIANPDNPFLSAHQGKWKKSQTFIYNDNIQSGNDYNGSTTLSIYNKSGVINDFKQFNWKNHINPKWYNLNSVLNYNENGAPIETVNDNQIISSTKLNKESLPSIIANNSNYDEIFFSSFEESSSANTGLYSHTGKRSLLLSSSNIITNAFKIRDDRSLNIKCWIHSATACSSTVVHNVNFVGTTGNSPVTLNMKATVGEWCLYEGNSAIIPAGNYQVIFEAAPFCIVNNIDDFKISPSGSQSNCFVYDVDDYKILATFDDQHFPMVYQYNPKNELIRKVIETEKGRKTVSDGFMNKLKIERLADNYTIPKPSLNFKSTQDNIDKFKNKKKKFSLTKEDIQNIDTLSNIKIKESIFDLQLKPGESKYKLFDSFNELDSIYNLNHNEEGLKVEPIIDTLNIRQRKDEIIQDAKKGILK